MDKMDTATFARRSADGSLLESTYAIGIWLHANFGNLAFMGDVVKSQESVKWGCKLSIQLIQKFCNSDIKIVN